MYTSQTTDDILVPLIRFAACVTGYLGINTDQGFSECSCRPQAASTALSKQLISTQASDW